MRRVHRCCVQNFVQISHMSWEEFKKAGLQHFTNLRKKKNGRQEWAWPIWRDFCKIQGTHGYKVVECAIKYIGVISQNALSKIIAPPNGWNSRRQWIIKFFARCDLYSKFLSFGVCSGSEKCDHLGPKSQHNKNNRDLTGWDLLRP